MESDEGLIETDDTAGLPQQSPEEPCPGHLPLQLLPGQAGLGQHLLDVGQGLVQLRQQGTVQLPLNTPRLLLLPRLQLLEYPDDGQAVSIGQAVLGGPHYGQNRIQPLRSGPKGFLMHSFIF